MKKHIKISVAFMLILILSAVTFCLSGCARRETREVISTWKVCGEIDSPYHHSSVYYDENTKVMYATWSTGLTVLLNADGTPMLWEEDKK